MKEQIQNLFKSRFIKNVLIMSFGAIGAQVVTLLLSPIITRLYGPEAFGMMGTFTAIINVIGPLTALTLPTAIVLPKKNKDAIELIKLSSLITVLFSLFTLLIVLMFNNLIVNIFNLHEISNLIYVIPIVMLSFGFKQIMEQWLIRTKMFMINATSAFLQSLTVNLAKVIVGLFYPFASILIIITALNNFIRFLFMLFLSKNYKYRRSIFVFRGRTLLKILKEYVNFPIYRMPETFFNTISQSLPILVLSSLFGPASAGFYSIGRTTLTMPSRLIGDAVGDVFYPRITEVINNKENSNKIILKASLMLCVTGVLPYGIVFIWGPELFSLVFGSDWKKAGEYARWISFLSYARFVNKPSVKALLALNALRLNLLFTIFTLIAGVVSLGVGYWIYEDDLIAVMLFGVSGAFIQFSLVYFTLKLSKIRQAS